MIADGHHRYSMALRYRDEMRAAARPGSLGRAMMLIVDAALEEPPVLPFHRIQRGGPRRRPAFASATSTRSSRPSTTTKLRLRLRHARGRALVHRVAELTGSASRRCAPSTSRSWTGSTTRAPIHARRRRGRGRRAQRRRRRRVLPAADRRGADPRRDRPRRTASPQKSTFFWPKPRTGLVHPAARPRRDRVTLDLGRSASTGSSFLMPAATTSVRLRAPAPLR